MKKLLFVACVSAALLSACGGGGSDGAQTATQSQASAPQSTQAVAKPVLIEAYGDSTMVGYSYPTPGQPAVQLPDNQPAVLQTILQGQYGSTVTVSNDGVSGSRAPQLVDGSDGYHLPWVQTVANSKAQIVIVNYGINDSWNQPIENVEAYKNALRTIADVATAGGKAVVFEQPNPGCLAASNYAEYMPLDTYAQAMTDVATEKNIPIADNFTYVKSLPDWQGMLSDCTHPKGELYALEAARLAEIVSPLVAKLRG